MSRSTLAFEVAFLLVAWIIGLLSWTEHSSENTKSIFISSLALGVASAGIGLVLRAFGKSLIEASHRAMYIPRGNNS